MHERDHGVLFDTPRFTRNLEAALQRLAEGEA
jgi:predicted O-linked N-acetylglucosamine transferase (SPINDLY family)